MDTKKLFGSYDQSVTNQVLAKMAAIEEVRRATEAMPNVTSIYSFNYYDYLKDKTLNEDGMDFSARRRRCDWKTA